MHCTYSGILKQRILKVENPFFSRIAVVAFTVNSKKARLQYTVVQYRKLRRITLADGNLEKCEISCETNVRIVRIFSTFWRKHY